MEKRSSSMRVRIRKIRMQQVELGIGAIRAAETMAEQSTQFSTGILGPIADAAYTHTREFVNSAVQAAQTFEECATQSTNHVQALAGAHSEWMQGATRLNNAYWAGLSEAMDLNKDKPQDLLQCPSPQKLAQIQSALYRNAITCMVKTASECAGIASEMAYSTSKVLRSSA